MVWRHHIVVGKCPPRNAREGVVRWCKSGGGVETSPSSCVSVSSKGGDGEVVQG